MYQRYKIPFKYDEHKDLTLSVEKEGEQFIYRRQCRDEEIEKILAMDKGELIVNPIEPLTKPKELTPYFLIMLDRSLMVEPRATKTIFLTFPIEVGVYIFSKEEFKSLDSYTFVKPKFTLYGDRGLEFYPGPAAQLPERCAQGWLLEGGVEQRRLRLRMKRAG